MSDREELEALRRMAELEAKASGKPATGPKDRQAIIADAKARGWGTGFPKFAHGVGGHVTDVASSAGLPPEAAAATGFGANLLLQAIPSFLTSAAPTGAPAVSLLEAPARKFMQSAVKPSSTLPPKDVKNALGTMLREEIYPTTAGMEKISGLTKALDEQVEAAIANSPANVSVAAIGSRLKEPFEKAKTQVNPQQDMAAIRSAWDEFKTSPLVAGKTEIPVQLAHEIKKGTYSSLGQKAYHEMGSSSIQAQKALARGAREEVAAAVPEVTSPLARQAALMNAKEVAATRALIEANKNPLGLAALRMDNPLSAATFLADRMAALKAFLAFQMFHGSKPQSIAPLGVAGTMATNQPALLQELGALQQK